MAQAFLPIPGDPIYPIGDCLGSRWLSIRRFDAWVRVNAMNASAAGCSARTEIPAAYVMTFCNSAGSGPTNSAPLTGRIATICCMPTSASPLATSSATGLLVSLLLGANLLGDAKLCQQTRDIGALGPSL